MMASSGDVAYVYWTSLHRTLPHLRNAYKGIPDSSKPCTSAKMTLILWLY